MRADRGSRDHRRVCRRGRRGRDRQVTESGGVGLNTLSVQSAHIAIESNAEPIHRNEAIKAPSRNAFETKDYEVAWHEGGDRIGQPHSYVDTRTKYDDQVKFCQAPLAQVLQTL